MLNCPECQNETAVIDSRESKDAIRRRRKCLKCGFRYTTYERVEDKKILRKEEIKKLVAYRKTCPKDERSDEQILESLEYVEEKISKEDQLFMAACLMGLLK